MKRILLIGPPPSTKGGVTIWIKIVLDYFRENKNDNISVTHLAIERSASLTHLLPTYKRLYYSIKDYTKGMFALINALQKGKYDKVHILSSLGAGIVRDWLYVKIGNLFKTKPIVHYHCGTLPEIVASKGRLQKLLLATLKNSYKSIVLDEESYKTITSLGLNNVVKIGNSFNLEIESLEKTNIQRKDNEILFVGHNVREKGIFELIEALCDIDNITLYIYGPQDATIMDEIDYKLRNRPFKGDIHFMGLQPSIEIFKAMRKAGIFILPTYGEGFPYVIVEAMASGCPIITTPVGAIEEMLTYNNILQGYLVEAQNVNSLREQFLYCINNRAEIREKANKAKEKAYKVYSTEAVMKRFIALWSE